MPIQLEICASAASYRKTLPMLNVCVSYTSVPSLPSQHSAQHMPCMQHCCKLNTRTCRATNLRVSLLALRCGILFARQSVRVCVCVSYFVGVCVCVCLCWFFIHPCPVLVICSLIMQISVDFSICSVNANADIVFIFLYFVFYIVYIVRVMT